VSNVTDDNDPYSEDDRRIISDAARRAASMDRLAELLLSVGCHHAAEHHFRRASELREMPA
jgi:hypothetical protein